MNAIRKTWDTVTKSQSMQYHARYLLCVQIEKCTLFFCHRNGCLWFLHHNTFGILSLNREIERERKQHSEGIDVFPANMEIVCATQMCNECVTYILIASSSTSFFLLFCSITLILLLFLSISSLLGFLFHLSHFISHAPTIPERQGRKMDSMRKKKQKRKLKMYVMSQSNIYLLRPIE